MNTIRQFVLEIIFVVTIIGSWILRFFDRLDESLMVAIIIFCFAAMSVKYLMEVYLNFVFQISNSNNMMSDKRGANFLNFDMLKFVLIIVSLLSVVFLGVNHILNNETIATLLGGLLGSLLTMDERDELNKMSQENSTQTKS